MPSNSPYVLEDNSITSKLEESDSDSDSDSGGVPILVTEDANGSKGGVLILTSEGDPEEKEVFIVEEIADAY